MPATSYKLVSVTVTGSKRFTSDQIAAACGLPVGTVAQEEDFKKAARQIGDSGAFNDISYTYSYSSAGTKLIFQVTDADKFVPAHFTDFVWFTDEELLRRLHERIPLYNGDLPSTGRLTEEVSDVLQAMLVENGVPGHVEYLRHSGSTGQVESIDFNVAGVSIRIHHVDFPGSGAGELPLLESAAEKMIDREYSRAYMSSFVEKSLLPIYHEHGYLKAICAAAEPKVIKPPASDAGENGPQRTYVDITFPVTPGAQYKVAGWEWSGNKEISTDTLQPLIHAKVGEIADTVRLHRDLQAIQELYGSQGFVLASVKADAEFDGGGTVTYRLAVNEGAQFHMGELEFRGLDNTLTARLRAAWKLRPGDIFDATYLKQYLPQSRKLLPVAMDWDIDPHVTAIAQNKTVDVDLQYTAKAPR
jgi:outer membrane protein insertion porin family